ncbi:MAG: GNAT family N-acetyltransferase [Bacteroidales bacterium]
MVSIKKFRFQDNELLRLSNKIRTLVFVEEQNVDPELEYEFEEEGNFYLMYFKNKPIATARWRETAKGIKLERFALLKEYRNRGLGTILLKELLADVSKLNKTIYLHSQVNAINYYKREGFIEKGDRFFEANIEHILMEYATG